MCIVIYLYYAVGILSSLFFFIDVEQTGSDAMYV